MTYRAISKEARNRGLAQRRFMDKDAQARKKAFYKKHLAVLNSLHRVELEFGVRGSCIREEDNY